MVFVSPAASCLLLALLVPTSDAFFNAWNLPTFGPVFDSDFHCKLMADRTGQNCQNYIKECENFWDHGKTVTKLTCSGDLFFSETFNKCVDPKTFNKQCIGKLT
ncbi:hypothetical protein SNE40_001547 [Patella caerulea]|uniref:Chitin-binding type-2 domain-containing protein n=1 Tax=Patella caerulea TaxID=87958 RepID=A0AAN8KHT6_PATCE